MAVPVPDLRKKSEAELWELLHSGDADSSLRKLIASDREPTLPVHVAVDALHPRHAPARAVLGHLDDAPGEPVAHAVLGDVRLEASDEVGDDRRAASILHRRPPPR